MTTQKLEQEFTAIQAQLATQHRDGDRVGKGSYHRNPSGGVAVQGEGIGIKYLGDGEARISLYDKVDGTWTLPFMAHSAYRNLEEKTFIYEGEKIKRYALEKPEGWIPRGMSEGETIAIVEDPSEEQLFQTILRKQKELDELLQKVAGKKR
jgi:hypothetical protein